ncbi:carboxypeptidase-like regulatory domain-containing protein [Emticicia agri]|uniref:Carboxypeptidase-like regulatory domain-containing protein n=1 Tax=Emticicia agri TaxID=2492393 RepID=A0A4Q5LQS5_9BACT|nr:carboxypeptidase-like regulatory domain-containing protein [Emticicia agri]RYU91757.1 hypothetical protein EWM59_26930 [Emticicia agri]
MTTNVWCQIVVTGQVINREDKSPMPWIQIIEKGTKNATYSNEDGTFYIIVSDANATLVFSMIGTITQEYTLKGASKILVKIKYDCTNHFFGAQKVGVYANSGVLNNPVGGQLYLALPLIYREGTITGNFSFQSNLRSNQFLNAEIEAKNLVLECNFNIHARWHYREVSYHNNFHAKAYTFETDFNIGKRLWFLPYLNVTAGYGNLHSGSDKQSVNGPVFGLDTYIGIRRFSSGLISGKVAIFRNKVEWQGQFTQSHRRFSFFIKYYQLKPFSELSLGIGKEFGYRFKRQRLKNDDKRKVS